MTRPKQAEPPFIDIATSDGMILALSADGRVWRWNDTDKAWVAFSTKRVIPGLPGNGE